MTTFARRQQIKGLQQAIAHLQRHVRIISARNYDTEYLLRRLRADMEESEQDDLAKRAYRKAAMAEYTEDGFIAIVYGFMDCDCAVSDGNVAIIPATVTHVTKWIDDFHEGAEGRQWLEYARPSDTLEITRTSRDLALEAFEDGHSHYVVF